MKGVLLSEVLLFFEARLWARIALSGVLSLLVVVGILSLASGWALAESAAFELVEVGR